MKHHFLYSTILAGTLGLSTLGLFYNGAEALDLSDFTGQDQRVITQDAPRAGGAVLVKEDLVYPNQPQRAQVRNPATAPIQSTAGAMSATGNVAPVATNYAAPSNPAAYNAVAPAAGNTGRPGVGIDNKLDVTTAPGNAFDKSVARFNTPGTPSGPVDGKPLVTDTLADGRRVQDNSLAVIEPAAGGARLADPQAGRTAAAKPAASSAQNPDFIESAASSRDSIQYQTNAKGSGFFNN